MMSSGGVDGSERSSFPNPASSGIGVKLSLSCAPADRTNTAVAASANHHRFLTLHPQRVGAAPPSLQLTPTTTLDVYTTPAGGRKIIDCGARAGRRAWQAMGFLRSPASTHGLPSSINGL